MSKRTLALVLLLTSSVAATPRLHTAYTSSIDDHSVKIGITTIKLTREELSLPQGRRSDEISSFAFLNLHENENTSVVAARSFLLTHGGSLVKFNNGFSRLISFQLSSGGATYSVDPNRIFTEEGIVATLKTYGMCTIPQALLP